MKHLRFCLAVAFVLPATPTSHAQTNAWSWVREDHVLNPSGLEVASFNAQFQVLDWNGDGRWDFVINDFKTLQLFIGVEPMPTLLWQKRPANFPTLEPNYSANYPPLSFKFVDFDRDGDLDLAAEGLQFWWNTGTNSDPDWQKDDAVLFGLGGYTISAFVDYDQDGDYDVTVSEYPELYWNRGGNSQPRWVADSSNISAPLENDALYTNAVYEDADHDGDLDLFVLSVSPSDPFVSYSFSLFRNDGELMDPLWVEQSSSSGNHFCPTLGRPEVEFLDVETDGNLDLVALEPSRRFDLFVHGSKPDSNIFDCEARARWGRISGASNAIPILFDNRHDGTLDLIVSEDYEESFGLSTYAEGSVFSLANENRGFDIDSPDNGWFRNPFPVIIHNLAVRFHLNFGDFDRDGDKDYLFSYYKSTLAPYESITGSRAIFYRNEGGDVAPSWTPDNTLFAGFDQKEAQFWAPNLIDIDADGDDDLFIKRGQYFAFYEQTASSPSVQWKEQRGFMAGISDSSHYLATFADLTRDGLADLIFGEDDGTLSFYENIGSPQAPKWEFNAQVFAGIDVDSLAAPAFGDMDSDGRLDLFVGNANGQLFFYRNESTVGVTEPSAAVPPADFALSPAFPNPFGAAKAVAPATNIDFRLPRPARVSLKIYNIVGQEVRTLVDHDFEAGRHQVQWDGRGERGRRLVNGVYLVCLKAGNTRLARKLTLIN